jgi:hypothetical protein
LMVQVTWHNLSHNPSCLKSDYNNR